MGNIRIGTHDGLFHADEVTAIAVLEEIDFMSKVIRSRDPEVLKDCDILVDVGGRYDPERGFFDHHQADFNETRLDVGGKLSSMGLVWREHGTRYIRTLEPELSAREVLLVWSQMDKTIVRSIDLVDNGEHEHNDTYNYSMLISDFNEHTDNEESNFREAVRFASGMMRRRLQKAITTVRAKDIVVEAMDKRQTPEVLILERYVPWQSYVTEEVQRVIYPRKGGGWGISTNRLNVVPFPEEWGGLDGEELQKVSGFDKLTFCHSGLWFCAVEELWTAVEVAVSTSKPA